MWVSSNIFYLRVWAESPLAAPDPRAPAPSPALITRGEIIHHLSSSSTATYGVLKLETTSREHNGWQNNTLSDFLYVCVYIYMHVRVEAKRLNLFLMRSQSSLNISSTLWGRFKQQCDSQVYEKAFVHVWRGQKKGVVQGDGKWNIYLPCPTDTDF